MTHLRISHDRIVAVLGMGSDERVQIRAADSESRLSILADVAARVVNTEYPAVEGTQIWNLKVRVAFLEGRATADLALRS